MLPNPVFLCFELVHLRTGCVLGFGALRMAIAGRMVSRFVRAIIVIIVGVRLSERQRKRLVVHHPLPENAVVDKRIDAIGIGEIEPPGDARPILGSYAWISASSCRPAATGSGSAVE